MLDPEPTARLINPTRRTSHLPRDPPEWADHPSVPERRTDNLSAVHRTIVIDACRAESAIGGMGVQAQRCFL